MKKEIKKEMERHGHTFYYKVVKTRRKTYYLWGLYPGEYQKFQNFLDMKYAMDVWLEARGLLCPYELVYEWGDYMRANGLLNG